MQQSRRGRIPLRRRAKPAIVASVKLAVTVPHQWVRRFQVRPANREAERHRAVLRVDIVEVRQAAQVGPEMSDIQPSLERCLAQRRRLPFASERV